MRKKVRLILVGALVAVAVVMGYRWSRNVVAVVNHSFVEVESVTVTVAGRDYTVTHIPPGGTVAVTFAVGGGGGISVHGKMADGTILHAEFGHVGTGWHGFHQRATVAVMGDKTLQCRQGEAEGQIW
jgi:hypothetical protein